MKVLSLVGYFHANERFDDHELSNEAKNIGDYIYRYFLQAAILLLDSKRPEALQKVKDRNLVVQSAPVQPGGYECGYYVMRYMREIIFDDNQSFPKWPLTTRNRSQYEDEDLDEIRIEVMGFITNMIV